jgi:hypothetical protein
MIFSEAEARPRRDKVIRRMADAAAEKAPVRPKRKAVAGRTVRKVNMGVHKTARPSG